MAQSKSWVLLLPLALFLPFLAVDGAEAQDQSFSFEARGGMAVPFDDTRSLWEAGPTFGGALIYWVNPQVGLRATGAVDLLSGKSAADVSGDADVPDMTIFSYTGGVEFAALPEQEDLSLSFIVGAGAASVSTDDYPAGLDEPEPTESSLSETYVTVNAGTKLGYAVHDQVDIFVGGQVNYVITDEEDFRVLRQLDADNPEGDLLNELWVVPVTAGIEIHF